MLFFLLTGGSTHEERHGAGGGKQHEALAQRIEGAVVENHARHGVDSARLLHALLHIALGHFIDGGGIGCAVLGQVTDDQQHKQGKDDAQYRHRRAVACAAAAQGADGNVLVLLRLVGHGLFGGGIDGFGEEGGELHFAPQPAAQEGVFLIHVHPPVPRLFSSSGRGQ